jgi:hypothetical protein
MSRTHIERKYRCWNDCIMQGCPGHKATIDYQSVSNAISFNDGKGQELSIQTPELEAFISMINELAYSRVEIESAVSEARFTKEGEK